MKGFIALTGTHDMRKQKRTKAPPPKADVPWFEDNAERSGTTLAELSRELMGHKDLLRRSLRGERDFTPREIFELSERFAAPLSEIFARLGYKSVLQGRDWIDFATNPPTLFGR
jgi:hypothetical protein